MLAIGNTRLAGRASVLLLQYALLGHECILKGGLFTVLKTVTNMSEDLSAQNVFN
jgi:hypothetical protein